VRLYERCVDKIIIDYTYVFIGDAPHTANVYVSLSPPACIGGGSTHVFLYVTEPS